MSKYHCKSCKKPINYMNGLCEECKTLDYEQKRMKLKNRLSSKKKGTKTYAIGLVKEQARRDTWCTNHKNCFKCTIGKGENDKHIREKFERWLYHRKLGHTVFVELILTNNLRPDLVIIDENGTIWTEEIVNSESEESIDKKKKDYPWRVEVIRC